MWNEGHRLLSRLLDGHHLLKLHDGHGLVEVELAWAECVCGLLDVLEQVMIR